MLLKDKSKQSTAQLRPGVFHGSIALRPASDAVVLVMNRQLDLAKMNNSKSEMSDQLRCELSLLTQLCCSYLDQQKGGLIEYEPALDGFYHEQSEKEFLELGRRKLSLGECVAVMPHAWQIVEELVLFGDGLVAPYWRIDPSGSF